MNRENATKRRSGCPLNAALEMLGDRWSLLIVRDLMFKGSNTFKHFLEGGEGIATNILADRLQRLEAEGILDKGNDANDGRRVVYRLTTKGMDLAPALVELILWADRYEETAAPPEVIREMTHHRARFIKGLRKGWDRDHASPK